MLIWKGMFFKKYGEFVFGASSIKMPPSVYDKDREYIGQSENAFLFERENKMICFRKNDR